MPRWAGQAPDWPQQLVVFAPHPDDEVLGAAGLMTWCQLGGSELSIVAVTDGEASHPESRCISPADLRTRRSDERDAALRVLGLRATVHRLQLPDSAVGDAIEPEQLAERFAAHVEPGATIAIPSVLDDHPDHAATNLAGHIVASTKGCEVWEYAVWARVRHSNRQLGSTLHLGSELHRVKMDAVLCFRSQILPLGPEPQDGPVIDPQALASFTGRTETIALLT